MDALGDLPKLSALQLRNPERMLHRVDLGNHRLSKQRKNEKFRELEELEIAGTPSSMRTLMDVHFKDIVGDMRILRCSWLDIAEDVSGSVLNFLAALPALPPKIRMTTRSAMNKETEGIGPLNLSPLENISKGSSLTSLSISHTDFLYYSDEANLGVVFSGWTNLRHLALRKVGCISLHRLSPDALRVYDGQGLHFTCLASLSSHMPKLRTLYINVIACDTKDSDTSIDGLTAFAGLRDLTFGASSFVNREVTGFDQRSAANYISALMPRSSEVRIFNETSSLRETNNSLDWKQFREQHCAFMRSFTELVRDYMKIRGSEYRRVTDAYESRARETSISNVCASDTLTDFEDDLLDD